MSDGFFRVGLEKLAADDLVEVYGLFCIAYGFAPVERDKDFMRRNGLGCINVGLLDYRPFMGAKFFGQKTNGEVYFHGYTEEYRQDEENRRFQEAVREYFESKKTLKSRKRPR